MTPDAAGRTAWMTFALLAACAGDGPVLPAQTKPIDARPDVSSPTEEEGAAGATREMRFADDGEGVAAADLDGDGFDELIYVSQGEIVRDDDVLASVGAKLMVVARGDINADGKEEALLGFGAGKGFRQAPAQIWVVDADGATILWQRDRERNQIADLHVIDGKPFVAAFKDGRTVEGGFIVDNALQPLVEVPLGVAQLPLPTGDVVVGRLYGDEPRSSGDLQLRRGQTVDTKPTNLGVKALDAANLDDDPELEVLVADGWHFQYGLRATAHVTLFDGVNLDDSRSIALLPDNYTIEEIEILRDRPAALLTASSSAFLIALDGLGWKPIRLDDVPDQGNAVVAYLEDGPWVLISGTPATLIPLPL
ncbi:MAG: hypothetical protein AAFV53_14690 [Myxococcota bacterium]